MKDNKKNHLFLNAKFPELINDNYVFQLEDKHSIISKEDMEKEAKASNQSLEDYLFQLTLSVEYLNTKGLSEDNIKKMQGDRHWEITDPHDFTDEDLELLFISPFGKIASQIINRQNLDAIDMMDITEIILTLPIIANLLDDSFQNRVISLKNDIKEALNSVYPDGLSKNILEWGRSRIEQNMKMAEAYRQKAEELEAQLKEQEAEIEALKKERANLEKQKPKRIFKKDNGLSAFASASFMAMSTEILGLGSLAKDSFSRDQEGKHVVTNTKNGKGIVLWMTPEHDTDDIYDSITSEETLIQTLDNFGPEAACLHLLYACITAENANPSDRFAFNYQTLCEYLGLDQVKESRHKKINKLATWCTQAGKIVCAIQTPDKKGTWIEDGRIWTIERSIKFNDLSREAEDIIIKVTPGSWTEYFLDKDGNHTRQISHITQDILKFVARKSQRSPGTCRLMLWLLFKHRQDGKKGATPVTVRTCLEKAYGKPRLIQALDDKTSRRNIINSWEKDLLCLHEEGWKISPDNWPDVYKPLWMTNQDPGAKHKNYFNDLLDLRLIIYPPGPIITELDKLKTQDAKKKPISVKAEKIPAALKDRLKETRNEKGLKQDQAAEILGISLQYYKKLEQGKRSPSSELNLKIKKWLG